jgi:hypothetical protein
VNSLTSVSLEPPWRRYAHFEPRRYCRLRLTRRPPSGEAGVAHACATDERGHSQSPAVGNRASGSPRRRPGGRSAPRCRRCVTPAFITVGASPRHRSRALLSAESAHTAGVITAAGPTDLIESSASGNAGDCKRQAAPRGRQRKVSDAGAKQSRFQCRRHRSAPLLADRSSHETAGPLLFGGPYRSDAPVAARPPFQRGVAQTRCADDPISLPPWSRRGATRCAPRRCTAAATLTAVPAGPPRAHSRRSHRRH